MKVKTHVDAIIDISFSVQDYQWILHKHICFMQNSYKKAAWSHLVPHTHGWFLMRHLPDLRASKLNRIVLVVLTRRVARS